MRRMSASLFYSRTVDLFVEVKERASVPRCFATLCVQQQQHIYVCTLGFGHSMRERDDLFDGEIAINMDDEA